MTKTIALSPKATDEGTMLLTFPEAIQAVIDGHKITKLEWNDESLYGFFRDNRLMIKLADGWHLWIVSDGDLFGTDWRILD
jgi:hypothetical protein